VTQCGGSSNVFLLCGDADASAAAERGRDLIENILTFGRRRDARVRPVQVRDLFEEAASLLRASLPAGVELIIEDVPVYFAVSGEPAELQQVILNLCTNAAQAMVGVRRLGSGRELWLDHLGVAENSADDVVEVMRNAACQRSNHLHAARPFQARREFRPVALEKSAASRTTGTGKSRVERLSHAG
jgi:C4-dicarboxylate-specific signal transduction histidine kinase